MKTNFGKNKVFPEQKSYVKKGGFFQTDGKNKKPFKKDRNEDKSEEGNFRKPFKKDGFFQRDNSSNKKFFNKEKKNEKTVTETVKKDKSEKKPFDKKTYRLKKYSLKYKLDKYEDNRKKAVLRKYYKELKSSGQPTGQKYIDKGFDEALGTDSEEELNHNEDDEETEGSKVISHEKQRKNNDKDIRQVNTEAGRSPRKNYVQNPEFVEQKTEKTDDQKLNSIQNKGKAFWAAKKEFNRLKEAKLAKKEEIIRKKSEKEEAINNYKKKKAEKFKKLNKKTKRGQPIMKERIEMLLEQIEKMT